MYRMEAHKWEKYEQKNQSDFLIEFTFSLKPSFATKNEQNQDFKYDNQCFSKI